MKASLTKCLIVAATCSILYGCSTVYDNKYVEWQTVKPESFPVLTAIGQAPISLQNSPNKTQQMLMAINASKLAAYAELAEQVNGQHVNGQTTMSNYIINDQELRTSVQGIIRGAKVIKSYPVGDTYTTELRLDFKDVYDIYVASSNKKTLKDVTYY